MPAPAMSSRHLYTEHRRGHIQAAPRLRAHRGEPLSRDHPQIPVSMPSLFRFDASAVVHTCSSSHRTPAPLTARRQPQRSPPRLLTDAACGGLESPPVRRPRRTYLHHWHSTDRADDLLHHHHFPSGHTWVPIIRSWALTRGFALHPGTRNRYEIRDTRTQHRPASRRVNDHGRVSGTHRSCCASPLGQPRTAGRSAHGPTACRKQRGCTASTSSDPGENANSLSSNQPRRKAREKPTDSTVWPTSGRPATAANPLSDSMRLPYPSAMPSPQPSSQPARSRRGSTPGVHRHRTPLGAPLGMVRELMR